MYKKETVSNQSSFLATWRHLNDFHTHLKLTAFFVNVFSSTNERMSFASMCLPCCLQHRYCPAEAHVDIFLVRTAFLGFEGSAGRNGNWRLMYNLNRRNLSDCSFFQQVIVLCVVS